jgi:hypothetical protein
MSITSTTTYKRMQRFLSSGIEEGDEDSLINFPQTKSDFDTDEFTLKIQEHIKLINRTPKTNSIKYIELDVGNHSFNLLKLSDKLYKVTDLPDVTLKDLIADFGGEYCCILRSRDSASILKIEANTNSCPENFKNINGIQYRVIFFSAANTELSWEILTLEGKVFLYFQ